MCVSPVIIPNPNYGFKGRYAFLKDCVSKFIKVPCGHCSECVHTRQLGIVQRCMLECLSGYPFFCTLTYNNESLPVMTVSSGYDIRFADFRDVTNMVKRLRKENSFGRRFRYFAVSELGSKRSRPHFHLLFFVEKLDGDTVYTPLQLESVLYKQVFSHWTRNIGTNRKPVYKPLCTFVQRVISGKIKSTYDLHYVQPSSLDGSSSDVLFYVSKYMLKPSDKVRRLQSALKLNLPEDEYNSVWSVVKPRWVASLNFGFGIYDFQCKRDSGFRKTLINSSPSSDYLRKCISRSRYSCDFPTFFSPDNGTPLPFSRYWRSFGDIFTPDDVVHFHFNAPNQRADNVVIDERSETSKDLSIENHLRQLRQIDERQFNFDLFFD